MMKYLHEKYPTRFGIVFLLVYGALDVADARWFIPKRYKTCIENCDSWIIIKEDGVHGAHTVLKTAPPKG